VRLLIDTGIIVAAADSGESNHEGAAKILAMPHEKLVTDAILSESHHLIAARVGWDIAAAFLGSVDRDLLVQPSTPQDRERARNLCQGYLDARLDFTDALTIAIAERLNITTLATIDERHFRLVTPNHGPMTLIP
jgi:uncharacterized protein